MYSKIILTTILLGVATASHAGLVADEQAHKACQERFESINKHEELGLKSGPTYRAEGLPAGRYQYYFNAQPRHDADGRAFRVECEALRVGKVTRFTLEPGSWRFEAPAEGNYAVR